MKTKYTLFYLFNILILLSFTTSLFGQRCDKKNYCDKADLEDYDYRGQSSYAMFSGGDKAKIKIVTYSGQEYKFIVCSDPELGQVQFKVLDEIRKYERRVVEVNEEEVPVYKENEYGAYETDDWGDYIEIGTEIQRDTTWERIRKIEEKLIFDNLNNKDGNSFWKYVCKKTKVYVIEITVPEGSNYGCVNVMIGHRSIRKGPTFYNN